MKQSIKKFFSHKEDYNPRNRIAYEIYTNCKFLVWALLLASIAFLLVSLFKCHYLEPIPYGTNPFELFLLSIPSTLFGWDFGFGQLDQSGWSTGSFQRLGYYYEDLRNAFYKTFFISFALLVVGRYFILVRKWVLKNK